MGNIFIFGGTTEGRLLAEFCAANRIRAYVSVATAYGAELLADSEWLEILTGRVNADEMADLMAKNAVTLVLDATHPYAVEATRNIVRACGKQAARYVRIARSAETVSGCGKSFESIDELIEYLNRTEGNILLTTGSKELARFCSVTHFRERCAVRVLPAANIVEECAALGFAKENVIAAKGPFSEEQNIRHIRQYNARFLVTKESGAVGGFGSKASAAAKCGAELLVIKRPQDSGVSVSEAEKILMTEKANE